MTVKSPRKFAHVVYRTRRFNEMLSWYQTVFGATVNCENPVLAFLSYDDEHHRMALINLDVLKPEPGESDERGMIGVDHVAYTYSSLEDLLENYKQLKDAGIAPYWCVHHGMAASMYYADPDGNQMEFSVDVFPTGAEAVRYMHGAGFVENPVGVEYDPDELLEEIRAGKSASDFLLHRASEPVSPIRGKLSE